MMTSRFKFGIGTTLIISGGLPLVGSILIQLYLSDWRWIHEPLHFVVEATGAFIALLVAVLLLLQMRVEKNVVHYTWVSSAFISMGLWDGFHAGLHVGDGFVLTHSLATLAGGFLFSLICLPDRLARTRFAKSFPGLVAIATTVTGILVITFRNQLPAMVNESGFTLTAKAINFLGGLFFMAAGACLVLRYRRRGSKNDLLFANQCLLFGMASLLFGYSTLWDASWWYWHLLRLLAFFTVLGYAFSVYYHLQEELRGSEARSRALLNAIPDLIIRFDLDGTLLDFQAHEGSLNFGTPPQLIVGANIYESPMKREVVNQIMGASRRAVETGDAQTVEFVYPKESELRHYEARIVASGPEELVAIVRNITGQKRAEEELRKAEQQFTFFMENLPGISFIKDRECRHLYVNQTTEKLFSRPRREILGKNNTELWPPEIAARIEADDRTVLEKGEILHVIEPIPQPDGLHYYHTTKFPILDPQGVPYLLGGIAIDITEQREAEDALRSSEAALRESEEKLRALTARLIAAREEETRRLARELHDVFSQRLAVLGMQTASVEQQVICSDPECCKVLHNVGEEIGSLAGEVHQLSRQLHPSILDDLGLTAALRAECASFARQHGIPAKFMPNNVPESLPSDISLSLYRIAQESLWNAAKHAEAKEVLVTLTGTGEEIVLAIHDDGNGFDLAQIKGKGGLGLVSMEERGRMVNGSFSVTSEPGKGTSVEVHVPWSGNGS